MFAGLRNERQVTESETPNYSTLKDDSNSSSSSSISTDKCRYHGHFDCFSGAAGDMILASCIDAANSLEPNNGSNKLCSYITKCIKLGIPEIANEFNLSYKRVWRSKGSIAAIHVQVTSVFVSDNNINPAPVPTPYYKNNTATQLHDINNTETSVTTSIPDVVDAAWQHSSVVVNSSHDKAKQSDVSKQNNSNQHFQDESYIDNQHDQGHSYISNNQKQTRIKSNGHSNVNNVQNNPNDNHSHTHSEHSHGHNHSHSHNHTDKKDHSHCHSGDHDHSSIQSHEHDHSHNHNHDNEYSHIPSVGVDNQPETSIETKDGKERTHTHSHNHSHSHTDHIEHTSNHGKNGPIRNLPEIRRMLETDDAIKYLPEWVRLKSIEAFTVLAYAEASVHGASGIETVHFHEVGAIDSIIDMVGSILAIHTLGINTISCSRLPIGDGMVYTAHGLLPVPTPATLYLMKDMPTCSGPYGNTTSGELVTPTGAALLRVLAYTDTTSQATVKGLPPGRAPQFTLRHIGVGAGTKDFVNHPNILRLLIGDNIVTKG